MKKYLLVLLAATAWLAAQDSIQDSITKAAQVYSKEYNNTGVLLLYRHKGQTYKASAGLADREANRSVKTDDLFEIGSASKVFTGVAVFQLIEQGKLSLDTKISRFYKDGEITKLANYKGKNYWNDVTVGMLLRHRSGFVDYFNVFGDDEVAAKKLGGEERHYTFDQLIHMAAGHGDANFKPGQKYEYCNTGYVILGDIITKVSGMNWRDYIRKNIMDEVGMKHTYFGTRIPKELRAKMPRGYMHFRKVFMPPSLANAAGEIISDLDDLASFIEAWGSGKLYQDPKTLQLQLNEGFVLQYPEMISNYYYGNAITKIDGFYGHGGQTLGFQSYMTINPKTGDIYIVGINDSQIMSMNLFMQLAGIEYKHIEKKHSDK